MEAAKHMLLPNECRLGYLYNWVATNLGLPSRSFRLDGTSFSDRMQLPFEEDLDDYMDVTELGGLHLIPLGPDCSEPSPEPVEQVPNATSSAVAAAPSEDP
eukprot:14945-Prorocentrum_lima.AAC.1